METAIARQDDNNDSRTIDQRPKEKPIPSQSHAATMHYVSHATTPTHIPQGSPAIKTESFDSADYPIDLRRRAGM